MPRARGCLRTPDWATSPRARTEMATTRTARTSVSSAGRDGSIAASRCRVERVSGRRTRGAEPAREAHPSLGHESLAALATLATLCEGHAHRPAPIGVLCGCADERDEKPEPGTAATALSGCARLEVISHRLCAEPKLQYRFHEREGGGRLKPSQRSTRWSKSSQGGAPRSSHTECAALIQAARPPARPTRVSQHRSRRPEPVPPSIPLVVDPSLSTCFLPLSLDHTPLKMRISDKIKKAEREGRPWWSFEFFPCVPRLSLSSPVDPLVAVG